MTEGWVGIIPPLVRRPFDKFDSQILDRFTLADISACRGAFLSPQGLQWSVVSSDSFILLY